MALSPTNLANRNKVFIAMLSPAPGISPNPESLVTVVNRQKPHHTVIIIKKQQHRVTYFVRSVDVLKILSGMPITKCRGTLPRLHVLLSLRPSSYCLVVKNNQHRLCYYYVIVRTESPQRIKYIFLIGDYY